MGTGKKKIEIKKKEKESDRMVTFSKRKQGLFNKASQLSNLSGSQVGILVFSPAGRPHTNAPCFDVALSSYFQALEARGGAGATTIASDVDISRSKDDLSPSMGLWLNSAENLYLAVEGGASGNHANGSTIGSENNDLAGMWLNSVESLPGEGGVGTGCFGSENSRCIKEWLNCIEVEGVEKMEDLLVIKQTLQNIREKVTKKIEDAIFSSYFV